MRHIEHMKQKRMKAEVLEEGVAYAGFFELRRLTLQHDRYAGGTTGPLVREVLHRSDVVAALLYDPVVDKFVLVEQFRVGAHAAGIDPWLIDIVAGRIEKGQTPIDAVMREIFEETGLVPTTIEAIGGFMTAPHLSSERAYLYYATVNASDVAGLHGVAHEGEDSSTNHACQTVHAPRGAPGNYPE
ncbi:MAG: NUDIX domain-containing protein [Georgfuchsia sp.]|jgi:ADP-ribose pyrophosphatase